MLTKKLGDKVKKGETILKIYSQGSQKLEYATQVTQKLNPYGITGEFGEKMLMDRIPSKKIYNEKPFILER